MGEITRLMRATERTSQRALTQEIQSEMEQAKLANASGHELPNGRSPSVTEQDHQTDAAGSAGKKVMALKERGWVALTALAAGYLGGIITAQSAAITLGRTRDSNVAREKFRFARRPRPPARHLEGNEPSC